jgi:transcriptional regulator with XRE-family HTH domain
MGFLIQHEKLRLYLKKRIDAGESTATELAKRAGLKQATISNIVNGRRGMRPATADRLLQVLGLSDQFLLAPANTQPRSRGEAIPVVRHISAITAPLITRDLILRQSGLTTDSFRNLAGKATPDREAWTRFVAIIVTRGHAKFLQPVLSDGAMLIIDRHYQHLDVKPRGRPHLYAVNRDGFLSIGYLEPWGNELILRPHTVEIPLQHIPLGVRHDAAQVIVGRICKILIDL